MLLCVYLLSATELRELLKLPQMVQHYKTHKAENKTISFLDFLDMHYASSADDDEQDKKLPFKSHDSCGAANAFVFIGSLPQAYNIQPLEVAVKKTCFGQLQFIPSSFEANIWQPPKSC